MDIDGGLYGCSVREGILVLGRNSPVMTPAGRFYLISKLSHLYGAFVVNGGEGTVFAGDYMCCHHSLG